MEDYSAGPVSAVPNSCQCLYSLSINQAMAAAFTIAKSTVVEPIGSHLLPAIKFRKALECYLSTNCLTSWPRLKLIVNEVIEF